MRNGAAETNAVSKYRFIPMRTQVRDGINRYEGMTLLYIICSVIFVIGYIILDRAR